LICVILKSDHRCLELLLKHGSKTLVNETDASGKTPLIWASYKGYHDTAKILLEYGADVNASDKKRRTPLHYACENLHLKCVKLLLSYSNVNPDLLDFMGSTALNLARNDLDITEMFAHFYRMHQLRIAVGVLCAVAIGGAAAFAIRRLMRR